MASEVDYPLVSIIVPMYNVGKFALPCVRSLLSQTYPNIEILIVDDGCTDNTIDLIEDTVGDDPRVVIHHKENGGLSSARNYGTQRCRGNYLMYVDGDDLIDPRTIELSIMADKTEKKPGFVAKAKAAVKGFCARVAKFFRDTKSELKKVVWPSKQDVKTNTIVVLVTVAIAAVVMILLDAIFGGILGLIIGA